MSTPTPTDVVTAAMSIAKDAAEGRLAPSELERQAVAELRELVGDVIGPDSPAWALQVDIARQVLALDGIPATELSEWLAVARHRAGEPVSQPAPEPEALADLEPPEPGAPETAAADAELAEQPEPPPADAELAEPHALEPTPLPPRRPGEYDPLAHWPPGRTLRG